MISHSVIWTTRTNSQTCTIERSFNTIFFQSKEIMWYVVLLIFGVNLVNAEHHSLQYFYTGTSGIADFPQFVAVGIVDGKQIDYYDSVIGKNVLKQAWMEGTRDENSITDIRRGYQAIFSNNIKILMERYNQTLGVHLIQIMYGCEVDDDGTKRGYMQHGYDGEDFLTLVKSSRTWTAANPQAMITKVKWDSTGAEANAGSNYLDNTCIEWLNKYVDYGKDTLERKVSPQVSLLKKDSSSPVTCHATGFYPKEVTITWQRNGQDHYENVDLGELLPNEDGTFQKTSTLKVTADERKNNEFSCVVEHKGKTIREILTDDSVPIAIIVGVVAAALILLVVSGVVGFVVYRRKKGFKPVPQNQSSDNSSAGSS